MNGTPYGVIHKFEGNHHFLSNFYAAEFLWRGNRYATAEHAFQAGKGYCMKASNDKLRSDYMKRVQQAPSPAKAKYAGRSVEIDLDTWDAIRVDYMREIVWAKFNGVQGLAGKLVNTGCSLLVEGNDWGDTFWGRCNGKGLNMLGVILMEVRGGYLYNSANKPAPF